MATNEGDKTAEDAGAAEHAANKPGALPVEPAAVGALDQVTITVDGREVHGAPGEMLIATLERAGVYVPRFCYHPRMKPVAMCRMCLVELKGPRGFSLQPACFVAVGEGQEVVTTSDKVRKAQDGVLEFLLINHPLDCPVCDKGGECPLQDQTLAYGPGESRFVEEKRHFPKPIPISSLVLLDRERCIQCARCTRFAAEVAGDPFIDLVGRGDHLEVGVFPGSQFASYFSGNTVQICPVGALTATPYRFKARPWDLDQVESTCTTCAVGCRMAVQSSANRLVRFLGIDSDPVNHSWLCDRGRFGFEAVHSDQRVTSPLVRKDGELREASWSEAIQAAVSGLSSVMDAKGPQSIGVLGGARLANEDAYAWAKLAKAVIGTDSVDAQIGDGLPAEVVLGLPRATIEDAVRADAVVLLAPDLREELPVLFLRLRQSAIEDGLTMIELSPLPTSLTPNTAVSLRYSPGEPAHLVRRLLANGTGANELSGGSQLDLGPKAKDDLDKARGIIAAAAAQSGGGVVVVLGRSSLAEDGRLAAEAALLLAEAGPKVRFLPALRRGNVMGALDMGLSPGLLPGRVSLEAGRSWFLEHWGSVPKSSGLDTAGILSSASRGELGGIVLLGADPVADFPDRQLATRAIERCGFIVAVDGFLNASVRQADVVLPVALYAERPGSTTNIEGRVSRLGQKLAPPGLAWPDWMVAVELAYGFGSDLGFDSLGGIWDEIERLAPSHAGLTRAVLEAKDLKDGVVVPLQRSGVHLSNLPLVDPIATPGIESVERQGAPARAGSSEPVGEIPWGQGDGPAEPDKPMVDERSGQLGPDPAEQSGPALPSGPGGAGSSSPAQKPPMLGLPDSAGAPHVPPRDSYSARLVTLRRIYDHGTMVNACQSLATLACEPVARVSPHDLEQLGVADGGEARLRSAQGGFVIKARADSGVPRGVVALEIGMGGNDASALVDASSAVTEVRMETP